MGHTPNGVCPILVSISAGARSPDQLLRGFPSSRTGEVYHPDSVVNLHKKILKDAGLEHIRFHDLRHTFATLALQNGVGVGAECESGIIVAEHTADGFDVHATRQMQQKAAEKMGSFMAQIR